MSISLVHLSQKSLLNTLVPGEKPGFQALSKGLIVLLCTEVIWQRVPDHAAMHSKCSAADSGTTYFTLLTYLLTDDDNDDDDDNTCRLLPIMPMIRHQL